MTTKKSGGLAKLLGISQAKYETLTKTQKVKLIDQALDKLEGRSDSASNVKRNKLNISRRGITMGPPKRKGKGTERVRRNPAGEPVALIDRVTNHKKVDPHTGRKTWSSVTLYEWPDVDNDKRTFVVTEYVGSTKLRQKKFVESYYAKGHAVADKARALAEKWIGRAPSGSFRSARSEAIRILEEKYDIDSEDAEKIVSTWERGWGVSGLRGTPYADSAMPIKRDLRKVYDRFGEGSKKNPASSSAGLSAAQKKKLVSTFTRLRSKAAKHVPNLAAVGLVLDPSIHDSPRHYAMTKATKTKGTVAIAPELAKLPQTQIVGVLMHELGHASLEMGFMGGHGKGGYDAKERKADRAAEAMFDTNIYYTPKYGIETTGKGIRPRPAGLR